MKRRMTPWLALISRTAAAGVVLAGGWAAAAPISVDQAEQFRGQPRPAAAPAANPSQPQAAKPSPAEAKDLFEQGQRFIAEKKPVEAANAFARAVDADPTFSEARGSLATLLMDLGRSDLAYPHYVELARQRPQDANTHYGAGLAAYRDGKTAEAIQRLGDALRLDPSLITARRDLGTILLANGRTMEASSLYGEAVRLRPDDADAHNDYGVVLSRVGDAANATRSFEKAISLNPRHGDAHYNLGLALMNQWKVAPAAGQFRKALELVPGYADAQHHLGRALARQGDHEGAAASFRRVIELRPNFADAHYELAMTLVKLNRQKEAIPRLTEALRHNPSHAEAHYQLGMAMLSVNNVNLAVPQFRAVVAQRAYDPEGHYRLAQCYRRQGKTGDAVASFREALRLRPGWPEASNDLAWLLATAPEASERDAAESLRLARQGFEASRRMTPVFLDSVAAAHASAGRFDEALAAQRQAVEFARPLGDAKLLASMETRAALYAEKKPYHETASPLRAAQPNPAVTAPAAVPKPDR